MKMFQPKLFSVLKNYKIKQLPKDIIAGVIVAIIAFPLSIALAIASGMTPERGLYSAIIGGFLVSFFGGSRVNIGGATAATVMTVFTIINKYGLPGLAVTSIMAGIILIIMGFLRLGVLLKYIPRTITLGFTAAIGMGIFSGQLKGFFGFDMGEIPVKTIDKFIAYAKVITTVDFTTLMVGIIAIAIIIILQKKAPKVPNSLVAIIVTTLLVKLCNLNVATIKSVYGELPSHFPKFVVPKFSYDLIADLIPDAFTLAILIAIVTLLACVVTDSLTGHRHNSNQELIAQGIANIFCGFFGAVPVAGAVARASSNVKAGGKTPIAGIVHSIVVLFILLFMMPLAGYIPIPALSAILIVVSYNMCNLKEIIYTARKAPTSDFIVLISTFTAGVVVNLLFAVETGFVIAAILFLKNMANVTNVSEWEYLGNDASADKDATTLKQVPLRTFVFEISGPMFFAAREKFSSIPTNDSIDCIILRMRSVPTMDSTALYFMDELYAKCRKYNITLIISHIQEQPLSVMKKAGFDEKIGAENFCEHIDTALERAAHIVSAKLTA